MTPIPSPLDDPARNPADLGIRLTAKMPDLVSRGSMNRDSLADQVEAERLRIQRARQAEVVACPYVRDQVLLYIPYLGGIPLAARRSLGWRERDWRRIEIVYFVSATPQREVYEIADWPTSAPAKLNRNERYVDTFCLYPYSRQRFGEIRILLDSMDQIEAAFEGLSEALDQAQKAGKWPEEVSEESLVEEKPVPSKPPRSRIEIGKHVPRYDLFIRHALDEQKENQDGE